MQPSKYTKDQVREMAERQGFKIQHGTVSVPGKKKVGKKLGTIDGTPSRVLVAKYKDQIISSLNEGVSPRDIAKTYSTSTPTVYRAMHEIGKWVFVPHEEFLSNEGKSNKGDKDDNDNR